MGAMAEWFSIEVSSGPAGSARTWSEAYGDVLTGVALTTGATEWEWRHEPWGSVLEIEMPDEMAWSTFLAVDAVRAALEAVPDPVNGLSVHPGRGGSSGSRHPRRPRPLAGSGAAALPVPEEDEDELAALSALAATAVSSVLPSSMTTTSQFKSRYRRR